MNLLFVITLVFNLPVNIEIDKSFCRVVSMHVLHYISLLHFKGKERLQKKILLLDNFIIKYFMDEVVSALLSCLYHAYCNYSIFV